MPQCIIFDCDGTLVDSEHLFNRALSQKLKERSIVLSVDELVTRFRGVKLATVFDALESEFDVELDADFIAGYRQLADSYFRQELVACEGAEATLAKINVPMCVATNGPLAKMKLALDVTNLSHYFGDNLFSAYDVGSWKPEPGLFLHAAKSMEFSPQECLVVEDSLVGIQAAVAAGMQALLYDPNHLHQSLEGVMRIDHFQDLQKILN